MPPRPFHSSDRALSSPAGLDEPQLLTAIQDGDDQAFAYLVQMTRATLVTYAEALTASPDEAEDLVHDVYAALWLRRTEWRVRGTVLPYLRRAVRNRALDLRKRTRRFQNTSQDLSSAATPIASDQRVLSFELEVAALTVLATLPLRHRQVFLLCGLIGYSHADAAKLLGLKPSTVNYYLVFARKGLFAGLRERHFDIPSWITKPEMFFTRQPEVSGNTRRCRRPQARITARIDLTRHDPTAPFATTDVRVIQR